MRVGHIECVQKTSKSYDVQIHMEFLDKKCVVILSILIH